MATDKEKYMKKFLKPDYLLCLLAIPMLVFALSRVAGFLLSTVNVDISGLLSGIAVATAEIVVIIFRNKITKYLMADTGLKTTLSVFAFSFVCTFAARSVFLRGCVNGGNAVCLFGACLFLGVFLLLLLKSAVYLVKRLRTLSFSKTGLIFALVILALLNLEAFLFCRFMKTIFVWDNAGYFTTVHSLNDVFPAPAYFKAVYNSIFETDYNYVIMLPASIMCKLFGKSRLVFVLSIVNFYLYPLFMMIYFCAKRYFNLSPWKIICIIFALPYLVFAANTGFIDIGGIIPVFAALILYFYGRGDKHAVLIGVLLAIAVYMRRWYSFFALSFVITVFIHSCTKKNLKAFFEILLSFGFVLLFFTQDFVSTKLLADYKYMYSAYDLGVKTDFMIFMRYFGVIMTTALCVYVFVLQFVKRKSICKESYLLFQALLMFYLFVSVQTHGQQHLSLYISAFALILMSILSIIKGRSLITVATVFCLMQTANTFVPRVQPTSIQAIKRAALIPDFSNYPKVDKNAESFLPVTEYMDREIGKKSKTVCLLASSLKLNHDTLKNAEVSLSVKQKTPIDRQTYFYYISNVDKRDGLSRTLFETDYILVPSELQIHLAPEEQKVISVPYEMITQGTGFGTAYRKQDTCFSLADGTEIYLYQKTRDVTDAEIEEVHDRIFN